MSLCVGTGRANGWTPVGEQHSPSPVGEAGLTPEYWHYVVSIQQFLQHLPQS